MGDERSSLCAGDEVLGVGGDNRQYGGTVLSVDGDSVCVAWAPPHAESGPATLARRDVEFVSRPDRGDALDHLLPKRLVDGGGRSVELRGAFLSATAVGIYFAGGETPPSVTRAVAACVQRVAAGGGEFGVALLEVDPLPEPRHHHRALLPESCLSVPLTVVADAIADRGLTELCRLSRLPALVLVDRGTGEIFTYDGCDALLVDPGGFPWPEYKSRVTRRAEAKARLIYVTTRAFGAALCAIGAYRVGGWIVRTLAWLAAEIAKRRIPVDS